MQPAIVKIKSENFLTPIIGKYHFIGFLLTLPNCKLYLIGGAIPCPTPRIGGGGLGSLHCEPLEGPWENFLTPIIATSELRKINQQTAKLQFAGIILLFG